MQTSSYLIGEDSLLIQCGEILLKKGHHIEAIITPVKKIQSWAKKNHILVLSNLDDLTNKQQKRLTVDYIFSIVNSLILPDSIIQLARCAAINYHDSLLPNYAGVNATSWSILNNETEHGITWHLMDNKIDHGEIIIQKKFPIYKQDSAFTLNLRCYETAIESFEELLTVIEKKQLFPKKQSLKNQNYYGAYRPLPCFGFIDWQTFSADKILALYKATTFNHYDNNFGTLKLLTHTNYLIVSKIEIHKAIKPRSKPGTILFIKNKGLGISTITEDVIIKELLLPSGNKIAISQFVSLDKIGVGYQLPFLKKNIDVFQKKYSLALKHEKYWVKEFNEVNEHSLFSTKKVDNSKTLADCNFKINLKKIFPNKELKSIKNVLLTAILIYLYRLNNCEIISTFVAVTPNNNNLNKKSNHLFFNFLPFNFSIPAEFSLEKTLSFITEKTSKLNDNKWCLTDIMARYPQLDCKIVEPHITIDTTGKIDPISATSLPRLHFKINEEEGSIDVFHRFDLDSETAIQDIIQNLPQHLINILITLIKDCHLCTSTFSFLTAHEKHKLLNNWGLGKEKQIASLSITSLFEKQVKIRPNHSAIIMNGVNVSYLELWELSLKVADFIYRKNIPKQMLIGIYLNRSKEMLATILGILKAGAVYVPLDTKYPLSRVTNIIHDARLSYIFTESKYEKTLSTWFNQNKIDIEIFCSTEFLKRESEPIQTMNSNNEVLENLAYIMYTSGTSGTPKGVMVSQKNILNYCYWFLESTQFSNASVIDFSSSIAFDISIPCTLAPLLIGGTIAIGREEEKTNPKKYLLHLKNKCITHVEITPGYLSMLLTYPEEVKKLTKLKYILLGADAISKTDVLTWLSLCPNHQLINEYGPTEATVATTSYFITPTTLSNQHTVPIGKPAYNTQCYVLDNYKNLCPVGMIGELYIGGAQVTKGYWGQPTLTQSTFIRSNISKDHQLIYKTGDIVCWTGEGDLQFLGRNDNQIKIQGYRIETSEIEFALLKISEIRQALVTIQEGKFKNKYLRAYIVSNRKFSSDKEIKKALCTYLPKYMLPKEYIQVDSIPLKENEKIDYNALEKQKSELLPSSMIKSSVERNNFLGKISQIWKNVFLNESINMYDNFFDIGGDSLIALQIVYEIQNYYNIDFKLQYLFEYPTIDLIANKVCDLCETRHNTEFVNKGNLSRNIVELARGTHKTPLFLIHPVGGTLFWYKPLASLLQGKYTIYGIQDPNIDDYTINFTSLEEMSDFYLNEIRKIYSGENFYIGGASFGATVAVEIANQLTKMEKKVDFLGLFDGWAHYPEKISHLNSFDITQNSNFYEKKISEEKKLYLIHLEQQRKELLKNYKIPSLAINSVLFKAIELWKFFEEINDEKNGWSPYLTNKINTKFIPGNHETMFFYPNVRKLAKYVEQCLDSLHKDIERLMPA